MSFIVITRPRTRKVKYTVTIGRRTLPAVSAAHVAELLRERDLDVSLWQVYNLLNGRGPTLPKDVQIVRAT